MRVGRRNRAGERTGVVKRAGGAALFEESVRGAAARYGIDMVFLVTRAMAIAEAGTVPRDLASIAPAIYAFNNQTEEGTPPTLPPMNPASGGLAATRPTLSLAMPSASTR